MAKAIPLPGLIKNWNGNLDGVGIWWGQELSNQEINDLYTCGYDDNTNALGFWNFEEGEGETVIDLSGNGNDGIINGATYSVNVPEQSCQLTTVNGCDSTAVLNLTITQPDTSYVNIAACDSVEWNGQTYTESGVYTNTYTNANGCDSVVTLDLIINNSTTSVENVTACESYTWNDSIYAESGTHTLTFSSPEIGANIEGGIIFFIDSTSNLAYVATENYISAGEWGCSNIEVDGAQLTHIGGGYQNTQDIINSDCGGNQSAALTCANYDNGFDDWFLPSRELNLIYENLFLTGVVSYNTGNSQNWYWSSTEGTNNDSNSASNINFVDGFIAENNNKNSSPGGIIAVRTFNINNCDSVCFKSNNYRAGHFFYKCCSM